MGDVGTKDARFQLRVSTDEKVRWQRHARHLKLSEFIRIEMNKVCDALEEPGRVQARRERSEMLGVSHPGSSTEARPGTGLVNTYGKLKKPGKAPRSSQERLCEHRVPRDAYCPRCDS